MQSPLFLGNPHARVILYLPTAPQLDHGTQINVTALIAANGNHWRKILTILAKLCAPDDDWRSYRDQHLLRNHEALCFADQLQHDATHNRLHLIAGKASWNRLGLHAEQLRPLDDSARVLVHDNQILTPYPDYRQFPNALIAQLRPLIQQQLHI